MSVALSIWINGVFFQAGGVIGGFPASSFYLDNYFKEFMRSFFFFFSPYGMHQKT